MGVGEALQSLDGARPRLGVRVRDDDERSARLGDPSVGVRREAERPLVEEQSRHELRRRRLGNHDELVDQRSEGGESAVEPGLRPVRDDDAGDAHRRSRYTASVRWAVSAQLK